MTGDDRRIGPGDGMLLSALAFGLVIGFVLSPLVMTLLVLCLLLGVIIAAIVRLSLERRDARPLHRPRNGIEASLWRFTPAGRRQALVEWYHDLASTPQPDEMITYAAVARTLDPEIVKTIERRRDARPLNYTRVPVTVATSDTSTGRAVWIQR